MSNPISDFYDVIWTFEKGEETIDALFFGELTLDSYAKMLYDKRKAFESYVIDIITKGGDCSFLSKILERLPPQLERYDNLYTEIIPIKGTRAYCEYEYHNVRFKEISIAVRNTCDLLRITKGEAFYKQNGESRKKIIIDKNIDLSVMTNDEPINVTPMEVIDKNEIYQNTNDVANQYHFYGGYSEEQLEKMYEYLLMRGFMPNDTDFDDFVYYMTGKGDKLPQNGLEWCKDNVDLGYFIATFFDENTKKWKIGEMIFGRKRLASAYGQSKKGNPFSFFKSQIFKGDK